MKKVFRLHENGELEYIGSGKFDETSIIAKYLKSLDYQHHQFTGLGVNWIGYCWTFEDGRMPWDYDINEAYKIEFRIELSGNQLNSFLFLEYKPSKN